MAKFKKAAPSEQSEADAALAARKAANKTHLDMVKISAAAGALAGAVARFVVGPLDVVKIRLQVQIEPIARSGITTSKYTSLRQALTTIVKEEGIQVSI